PSAFVGRWDAKKDTDPWAMVAATAPEWRPSQPMVSQDANRLATEAEQLAARAGERMAAHVRTSRLTGGHGGPLLREAGSLPVATAAQLPAAPEPRDLPPLPDTPRKLLGPSAEPPNHRRHDFDTQALARRASE